MNREEREEREEKRYLLRCQHV